MDVEQASASIDALIEKRAGERNAANFEEMAWKESARRHHERERRELRALWYAYHLDQAERLRRTMIALVEAHEAEAARLLRDDKRGEA